ATGYNPTDYFRFGAVRSVVSIAPASLRENRQGAVMARGQTLWDRGSLTALYAPKLADQPNDSPFSPDFGATNHRDRWLLAASQKFAEDFNPQFLLYGEEHRAPQYGVNLTSLLNDATVGYLEWSGGRGPSLLAQALAQPDDGRFRSRAATGLTYTAPSKLSVTLEYDYNEAGLDENGRIVLRDAPASSLARYGGFVQAQQDLATKQNVCCMGLRQYARTSSTALTVMQRFDVANVSRRSWIKRRYQGASVAL